MLSLPGRGEKGQYEGGMKMQMFQFIFISMTFHYGVEINVVNKFLYINIYMHHN